jgi:hypothetical protein
VLGPLEGADLIQASDETSLFAITSVWNKEELPDEWKESIVVPAVMNRDSNMRN